MKKILTSLFPVLLASVCFAEELTVAASSCVVFSGEDSAWIVKGIADKPETPLTWKVRDGQNLIASREERLNAGVFQKSIPLENVECGYFSIEVQLEEICVESAIAVVPEPRKYGVEDPRSFFGLAGGERNPAMLARLGAKRTRLWSTPAWQGLTREGEMNFRGLDQQIRQSRENHLAVTIVATAGLQNQFPHWSNWRDTRELVRPENLKYWARYLSGLAEQYRGTVDSLEIQNEPDIYFWHRPGIPLGEAAKNYAAILETSYRAVKQAAPEMDVYGLDVSGRDLVMEKNDPGKKPGNFAFSRAVLEMAPGTMDLVTPHPYSHYRSISEHGGFTYPEEYDMAGLMTQFRSLAKMHGHSGRMAATEIGWKVARPELPVWSRQYFLHAAVTARALVLLKTVPGLEKVIWFHLHAHHGGFEDGSYNLAKCRNPLGIHYEKCDFDHLYPVPAASAYAVCAWMLEDTEFIGKADADSKLSIGLFRRQKDGKCVAAVWTMENHALRLERQGEVEAFSIFGRKLEDRDGIELNEFPVYLCGEESEVRKMLSGKVSFRQRVIPRKVAVNDPENGTWILANLTDESIRGELGTGGKVVPVTLLPGENPFSVKLAAPLSLLLPGADRLPAEIEARHYYAVPRQPVDLNASDTVRLDTYACLTPPDAPWGGVDDFSVRASIRWSEDALIFHAAVRDDIQAAGDSLQLAVNVMRDSAENRSGNDYEYIFRYGCAVEQTHPASGTGLPHAVISRQEGETVYEIRIPWRMAGLEKAEPERVVNFNFAVSDDDGNGIKSTMSWSDGFREKRIPALFKRLVLKE